MDLLNYSCLNKATEVKVTGKVNEVDWYEAEINGEKGYIAASLLGMEKPADQQQQPQTPAQTQNPPSTDTGSQTNIPSGWTDNGDGTYTDDNGGIRVINPATGDFYKTGDTNSQSWDYGTASDIFK